MKNKSTAVYNATNDFTERDKVQSQYNRLLANKFQSEVDQIIEEERLEALNTCLRLAIRDLSVWLVIIAFFLLAIIIAVQWIG